ncbi:MAG: hypothetical protein M3512_10835 [Bacteroidota bacterium]|nr:hypothetical protein [Bacteroidota bacterium]
MILSALGKYADKCWQEIKEHFPFVVLDEYVVMPNHIHGIVIIDKSAVTTESSAFKFASF